MPVWIFPFFFFLSEPKSQRGEAPTWFSLFGLLTAMGRTNSSSTVLYWNEKLEKGWLSGKHHLPFSSCMIFAFVGCVEGRLRDPSPVRTLAKNLTSPSHTTN